MSVRRLAEMTWEDVLDLEKSRTIAILPLGATEAHGPHLALSTDNVIAEAMAREGGHRLAARGYHVVILPTMTYTPARFGAAFAGTISIRRKTAVRMIVDVVKSLVRHGITRVVIANAHLDPAHLEATHAAVERLRAVGATVIFPDLTRKPWAGRMTEEFKTGACHAGRYESAVVLAERPGLVLEGVRKRLPPNPASLSDAIRHGKHTFEEAGGPLAYFGWPADATPEEGRAVVHVLGSILEDAVTTELDPGDGK